MLGSGVGARVLGEGALATFRILGANGHREVEHRVVEIPKCSTRREIVRQCENPSFASALRVCVEGEDSTKPADDVRIDNARADSAVH